MNWPEFKATIDKGGTPLFEDLSVFVRDFETMRQLIPDLRRKQFVQQAKPITEVERTLLLDALARWETAGLKASERRHALTIVEECVSNLFTMRGLCNGLTKDRRIFYRGTTE